MNRYTALVCAVWFALVVGCSSSEVDDTKAGENQTVLASWKAKSSDERLNFQGGKMILEDRHESGVVRMMDLIERPSGRFV